jgi:CDP-glucose 4,6-dehydratase
MIPGSFVSPTFWRDRNVLITGATGLLGSWMSQALFEAGANVVALVRDDVPASNLHRLSLLKNISTVRGELEDYLLLERALGEYEIETVLHFAAQTIVGIAARSPLSTFEANIRGTYNLLEAARRSVKVGRVVVASTDKAYGDHGRVPYDEGMTLDAVAPYDLSKACADQLALGYAKFYGLPIAVTRFGNLYGGGDLNWNRIVPGTVRAALRGEKVTIRSDGKLVRDYVYVQDAVAGYALLAEHAAHDGVRGRAFNFSDEEPLTVEEIARETLRAAGRQDLELVIEGGASDEIPYQALSPRRAREVLGWRPRFSRAQALTETVAWYRTFFEARP